MRYIIIPAKGDSGGLPGKNLQKINNRTLLEICIEKCLQVEDCHVFVSSDSGSITSIAQDCGANTIYRNKLFCNPTASSESAVISFIDRCNSNMTLNTVIAMVSVTCPMLTVSDIEKCLHLVGYTARQIRIHNTNPWAVRKPRQLAGDEYVTVDIGSCYANTVEGWLSNGRFNRELDIPVMVENAGIEIDIDNEQHLELARWILETKK